MMKITNQFALEFIRSMYETMGEICISLKNFGITNIAYGRFFKDGRRLYLNSHSSFAELYFKEELYNDISHNIFYTPALNTKYVLWSSVERDKVFELMDYTNICNGFSIYDSSPDHEYFEYFGFGGDKDNTNIANSCINHLDFFKDFRETFKKKNAHILNSLDQNRLIIPGQTNPCIPTERSYLIKNSRIENFKKQIGFSKN